MGCDFVVGNTDAQALQQSTADRRSSWASGSPAGWAPARSPMSAAPPPKNRSTRSWRRCGGSNMVFITAGMGGGTGTGAAPVIARAAREAGILTVGVVTKPFHFEGDHRMRLAEAGIAELQQFVDTLIVIPNQNLFRVANERTTFAEAFAMADEVLHAGVRGVTDLIVMPGLINLDFADIRSVISEMGKAMMGTGEAEGEDRAIDAAEMAISNPLLDDVSMKGAKGVLINITGGPDMMLFEVEEAANRIREEVDPDANIIFGTTFDETLEGSMRVSVVATGIDAEALGARRVRRSAWSAAATAWGAGAARGGLGRLHAAALDAERGAAAGRRRTRSGARRARQRAGAAAAAAAESVAMRGGAFIAPKPADAGPARPIPLTQPAVPVAAPIRDVAAPEPKGRVPSLIERVTGVGRARSARARARPQCAPADPARDQTGAAAADLARAGGPGRDRTRKTCSIFRPSCGARPTERAGRLGPGGGRERRRPGSGRRTVLISDCARVSMQQSAIKSDLRQSAAAR